MLLWRRDGLFIDRLEISIVTCVEGINLNRYKNKSLHIFKKSFDIYDSLMY
jgi:hypothetical protein